MEQKLRFGLVLGRLAILKKKLAVDQQLLRAVVSCFHWPNGLNWQCCLAGSFKTAPRILIFSIAIDANYTFYVKSIETHVRAYLPLIISAVSSVHTSLQHKASSVTLSQMVCDVSMLHIGYINSDCKRIGQK